MIDVIYVSPDQQNVELRLDRKVFYYHDKDINVNKVIDSNYASIPLRHYDDKELFCAVAFMNNLRCDSRHHMTVFLDKTNNRAAIGTIIK